MMKKSLVVLLLIAVIFSFCSCKVSVTTSPQESTKEQSQSEAVPSFSEENEDDKFNGEIRINSTLFNDDFNEVNFYSELDEIGGIDHSFNDDTKQYILKMDDDTYAKYKAWRTKAAENELDKLKADEECYVTDYSHSDNFDSVTLVADVSKRDSSAFDETALNAGAYALAYRAYLGLKNECSVKIVDAEGNEVSTLDLPIIAL